MIANYHTHTKRCRHAIGEDEEYIKRAIDEGVKLLGFSDHAPYIYPRGYESYYKMTPEESIEYFSSLRALRERYRDKIEIHIGYEAEYYPSLWHESFEFWKNTNPPEYLILGQHFVREECPFSEAVHSARGTDSLDDLKKYVDTVIEGIDTGVFTYVAHPDVIRYFGKREEYLFEMSRLLSAVEKKRIPLEINLLGLSEGRNYPDADFWSLASEYDIAALIGCDAHEPYRVAVKEEILSALRFADRYKIRILETVELIDPFQNN